MPKNPNKLKNHPNHQPVYPIGFLRAKFEAQRIARKKLSGTKLRVAACRAADCHRIRSHLTAAKR